MSTNSKHINSGQKGFTLIELLVVISIVALLSSVVLGVMATARKKGQDARVVSQRHQIQNAFELYNSNNGGYPNPTPGTTGAFCIGNTDCIIVGSPITTRLTALTMPTITSVSIPDLSGNANKGYIYISCGSTATFCPTDSAYLITTTYKNGVTYQKPGVWRTPSAYSESEIPFY
jgi:prepilin-type N-terminal cleavage/methylation domain-containing protein